MSRHILIGEGQPLVVAGLVHVLSQRDDLRVAVQAHDTSWEQTLAANAPDLFILDYTVSTRTPEVVTEVLRRFPAQHVLVVSDDDDVQNILHVVHSGIKGYVTRGTTHDELLMAVQATARGEKFFCHKILDIILNQHTTDPGIVYQGITPREREVLKLIASGYSTQRIADTLSLSPHTIHTHRKNIIRKLNIKSPTELVIHALDMGLIPPR